MSTSTTQPTWRELLANASFRRSAASEMGTLFANSRLRKCPYLAVAAGLALMHLGSSWLGYLLLSAGGQTTPVWPEAGLDLVALVVFGTRYWPVLYAAYYISSMHQGVAW